VAANWIRSSSVAMVAMVAGSLYIFLSLRRMKAGVLVIWNLAAREGDAVVSTEAERMLELRR